MTKDVLDRRVQKTRRLLQDALIGLISEKGFESVTIRDIIDRANVGRSTFYAHYENKNELLHSCFEEFHHLFERHKARLSKGKKHTPDLGETDLMLELFRYTARNHRLFKAVLGKQGAATFGNPIYEYVFAVIDEAVKTAAPDKMPDSPRLEMLAHYTASAFFGTLKWWIDKDMPFTVEEMDTFFKRLSLYDLKGVLGAGALHSRPPLIE